MYLKTSHFDAHKRVKYGFFGRKNGSSEGLYASLNCGIATNDPMALKNREAVKREMKASHLLGVKQCHSAVCVYADGPWDDSARPDADAIVTDQKDVAISVLTADCGPVLFWGEKEDGAPVIGAAHAGWGGALKGVAENTVQMMQDKGAVLDTVHAVIGPCIRQNSYEVSEGFEAPFIAQTHDNHAFFTVGQKPGHFMFDLAGYIRSRLEKAGVQNIADLGVDTYVSEQDYFSFRRATHRKEKDYGRQISVIVIK